MAFSKRSKRLRFRPEKEPFDKFLELFGAFLCVLLVALPAYNFKLLPESVPSHFDWHGQPNAYHGKDSIWILPLIGLVTYMGIAFLNRFPWLFNFPVEVTAENTEELYRLACRLLRVVNFLMVALFTYITWIVIRVGLGASDGLGNYFTGICILSMLGVLVYFMRRMAHLG